MNKIYYDKLNYTLFTETLENGLKVMYLKKEGFHKYSCYFGCNMGGKINKYVVDGTKYEIPLGVAHFLEHQLFEMPDGINASDYLSQYGIDNNAYTSYDRTMYLVSGTDHFDIALNYLLDFVQTPYFVNSNIDVEREIIIQELMMYQDPPISKVRDLLKKNVYGNISYGYDVGGTVEEVKKVDEEILKQVYDHFYIPENMYFGVIGSFDENYVFDLIRKNQSNKIFIPKSLPIPAFDKAPKTIAKHSDKIEVDVADSFLEYNIKINFNLKDVIKNNSVDNNSISNSINKKENVLTILLKCELLTEILFGPSSKNYQTIIDNELAFVGFRSNINVDEDFFDFTFSAYSKKPDELIDYLNNIFKNISHLEIDDKYLENLNKASLGMSLREYNSFDTTLSNAIDYAMDGVNSFDYYDYEVDKEGILEIAKTFDYDSISYCIGVPKNTK